MNFSLFDHIPFFVALTSFAISIILIGNKLRWFSKIFAIEDSEVKELRSRVQDMEKKILALELTIHVLLDKLAKTTGVVPEIHQAVEQVSTLIRPVLLVYGDNSFGEADRNAMRRAGISFFRLVSSNLEDLRTELHRRRSDGRMYDVVHISAHGGSGQINLDRVFVTGMELSDVLSNVRCVFLGTCSNQEVADKLVGIVKYVITVYEDIKSTDAADFTYEFYKRYKNSLDVEGSFVEALRVMPHVSEFVDLRVGEK